MPSSVEPKSVKGVIELSLIDIQNERFSCFRLHDPCNVSNNNKNNNTYFTISLTMV